jgi:hypothetical protein
MESAVARKAVVVVDSCRRTWQGSKRQVMEKAGRVNDKK